MNNAYDNQRKNLEAKLARMRTSLLVVILFSAGCSPPLPPVANPERAREGLAKALDAWQKGDTVEALQARTPAIHVNDPDWRSNKKLVKYQIESGQAHGNSWRCEVVLTVQDSNGNATPHKIKYIIDTDPTLVVVRD